MTDDGQRRAHSPSLRLDVLRARAGKTTFLRLRSLKLARAVSASSSLRKSLFERYGAHCDDLAGFLKMLCGDGERDPLRWDDYVFSSSSRSTYAASLLSFAAVIADACMLERVVEMDTRGPSRRGL